MGWRKLPSSAKGGIILAGIYCIALILYLISNNFTSQQSVSTVQQVLSNWTVDKKTNILSLIALFPFVILFRFGEAMSAHQSYGILLDILGVILQISLYFVIGAILGSLFWKKKTNNPTSAQSQQ